MGSRNTVNLKKIPTRLEFGLEFPTVRVAAMKRSIFRETTACSPLIVERISRDYTPLYHRRYNSSAYNIRVYWHV
jgi:hypothetical protein